MLIFNSKCVSFVRSEEVAKKVSELYENKWKEAMIGLGKKGGKKKNIEFLLTVFKVK